MTAAALKSHHESQPIRTGFVKALLLVRIFQSAGGEEGIALGNSSCKIDRSGNGLGVALGVRRMHFDQKRVARENLVIIVNNKTGRR